MARTYAFWLVVMGTSGKSVTIKGSIEVGCMVWI